MVSTIWVRQQMKPEHRRKRSGLGCSSAVEYRRGKPKAFGSIPIALKLRDIMNLRHPQIQFEQNKNDLHFKKKEHKETFTNLFFPSIMCILGLECMFTSLAANAEPSLQLKQNFYQRVFQ